MHLSNRPAVIWLTIICALISMILDRAKHWRMMKIFSAIPTSVVIIALMISFQLPVAAEQSGNTQEQLEFKLARAEVRIIELEKALHECRSGSPLLLGNQVEVGQKQDLGLVKLDEPDVNEEQKRGEMGQQGSRSSVSTLVPSRATDIAPPALPTVLATPLKPPMPRPANLSAIVGQPAVMAEIGSRRQLLAAEEGCC